MFKLDCKIVKASTRRTLLMGRKHAQKGLKEKRKSTLVPPNF
jgi:hypothetical protein